MIVILLALFASADGRLNFSLVISPGFADGSAARATFDALAADGIDSHLIDLSSDGLLAGSGLNTLSLTRAQVCGRVLSGSVAVGVVSAAGEQRFLAALAYGLAFYAVPVLVVNERDAWLADGSVYGSVVRVLPGWKAESGLWLALARSLSYRQLLFFQHRGPERTGGRRSFPPTPRSPADGRPSVHPAAGLAGTGLADGESGVGGGREGDEQRLPPRCQCN